MTPHVPDQPSRDDPRERVSDSNREPQVNLGGADAVQKTTAVGARDSTDPDARRDTPAAIPAGAGLGGLGWAAIALLLLVLVFYLSGAF